MGKWSGGRPCLLVLNRVDMVSPEEAQRWTAFYAAQGRTCLCTNGESGLGTGQVGLQHRLPPMAFSMSANAHVRIADVCLDRPRHSRLTVSLSSYLCVWRLALSTAIPHLLAVLRGQPGRLPVSCMRP